MAKVIDRLEQELADCKAMIERHGLGRNADAQRFREEIAILADKLQVMSTSLSEDHDKLGGSSGG